MMKKKRRLDFYTGWSRPERERRMEISAVEIDTNCLNINQFQFSFAISSFSFSFSTAHLLLESHRQNMSGTKYTQVIEIIAGQRA
jgi:hypothetical protein